MNLADGKTHSSSIEESEAVRVRNYFERGSRPAPSASSRSEQDNRPKIDLSNVSKPGDVMKAILARKQEAARAAQYPQRPASAPNAVVVRPPANAASSGQAASATGSGAARPAISTPPVPPRFVTPAPRPEPRKIVPQPRQAPPIVHVAPPASTPAIASRPPAGPVIARPPAGSLSGTPAARPAVAVAPPPVAGPLKVRFIVGSSRSCGAHCVQL